MYYIYLNFWLTVPGNRSGCDKQNCRYSRFEAAPVVVLTANIMLRRGGIWNLALKHHGKIFPWCLSLIPNRTSPQRDICYKSSWIDGS